MCDAIDPKEEKFRLISSVFYVGGDGLGLVLFFEQDGNSVSIDSFCEKCTHYLS